MRLTSDITASGTHKHMFCWDQMFYYSNRSPRGAKEDGRECREDLKKRKEKVSEVFEMGDQAPLYTKHPGIYTRDPHRRDLFRVLVLKMGIHFWRKEVPCDKII